MKALSQRANAALALLTLLASGCGQKTDGTIGTAGAETSGSLTFSDVTGAAGIAFKHNNGAFGLRLMPESIGSGAAFIDYDGDGDQDLFLVNGRDWTPEELAAYKNGSYKEHARSHQFAWVNPPARKRTTSALYRNNGDGTFADVTAGSGLDVEMLGMGAAVGDYDNDGKPDIYATGYGRAFLFRNVSASTSGVSKGASAPRFREVSDVAGVRDAGWSSSAAWLDYDRDGKLDLFVCHYIQWSPDKEEYAGGRNEKIYTGPDQYPGVLSRLYRNLGGGKFADVSEKAGINKQKDEPLLTKGLAVAVCDANNDLWPDIMVASDKVRNHLFMNNKNGTFRENAVEAGVAYNAMGFTRAGMGVDAGDVDHSNRESLVVSNFSSEMLGLYHNQGEANFADVAPDSEIGRQSLDFLSFGCLFVDVDLDGWLDIAVANGHINDAIERIKRDRFYAQRMLLFRNESASPDGAPSKKMAWREIGIEGGEAMQARVVGRGLAVADVDLDGDPDFVETANSGTTRLLRNENSSKNRAIRLLLEGSKSNRSAIGAVAWAEIGKDSVRRTVKSGSSFLSQSELPLTLGLGANQHANIVIRWPSGKLMKLGQVKVGQILNVHEDKGIIARRPFASK